MRGLRRVAVQIGLGLVLSAGLVLRGQSVGGAAVETIKLDIKAKVAPDGSFGGLEGDAAQLANIKLVPGDVVYVTPLTGSFSPERWSKKFEWEEEHKKDKDTVHDHLHETDHATWTLTWGTKPPEVELSLRLADQVVNLGSADPSKPIRIRDSSSRTHNSTGTWVCAPPNRTVPTPPRAAGKKNLTGGPIVAQSLYADGAVVSTVSIEIHHTFGPS